MHLKIPTGPIPTAMHPIEKLMQFYIKRIKTIFYTMLCS